MKKAFSRLITLINHLLAYLVSTLVKRWITRQVVEIHVYQHLVTSIPDVLELTHTEFTPDGKGKLIMTVSGVKEDLGYDSQSDCVSTAERS